MTKGKVLVTGHQGYIGSVMVPWLVDRGYDVAGLDTVFYGDECSFSSRKQPVCEVQKDIRDLSKADLEGFDAVVHLAALSNDPLGSLRHEVTYDVNHIASVRLAKLAREAGVARFLFSSSCSMHGASTDARVDETTPVNPLTPYGASKIRSEHDIAAMAVDGFSPVFMRNGTVYGVAPRLRVDVVLNNLVGWAVTTGKVLLYTDGTPWRPLIHVEDVCAAFTAALEAPVESIHNQVFHVGSNQENYQIKQLAEIVRQIVPECEIEYSNDHEGDQRTYVADFSKIENTLPEFRPNWTAELGAKQLYRAYSDAGLTLEQFTSSRYIRLKRIDQLLSSGSLDSHLRWQEVGVNAAPGGSS